MCAYLCAHLRIPITHKARQLEIIKQPFINTHKRIVCTLLRVVIVSFGARAGAGAGAGGEWVVCGGCVDIGRGGAHSVTVCVVMYLCVCVLCVCVVCKRCVVCLAGRKFCLFYTYVLRCNDGLNKIYLGLTLHCACVSCFCVCVCVCVVGVCCWCVLCVCVVGVCFVVYEVCVYVYCVCVCVLLVCVVGVCCVCVLLVCVVCVCCWCV